MIRLSSLLAVFGIGLMIISPLLLLWHPDWMSFQSILASDGMFDGFILYGLKGLPLGLLLAGSFLVLASVVVYIMERKAGKLLEYSTRTFLTALIIIKMCLCLITIGVTPYNIGKYDAYSNFHYAKNLAEGEPVVSPEGRPTAWWPIGYPLLLSLFFRILGVKVWVAQVINAGILTLTMVLTFYWVRDLMGIRIAQKAALVLTLLPSQTFYAVPLMSDMFFGLLLLALLWVITKKATGYNASLAGLLLGLAMLTRPTLLFFPLVLLLYRLVRDKDWKRALVHAVIIILAAEAVLLPWQIRNYRLFHQFVLVSTNGGHHLWMGNNPQARGGFLPVEWHATRQQLKYMSTLSEAEADRYALRQGLNYIAQHPLQAIQVWPKKLFYLLFKDSRSVATAIADTHIKIAPAVIIGMLGATEGFYTAVLLCFFLSWVALIRRERASPRNVLLSGTVLYFLMITVAFIAEGRYHQPLVPIFVLLAVWNPSTPSEEQAAAAGLESVHPAA